MRKNPLAEGASPASRALFVVGLAVVLAVSLTAAFVGRADAAFPGNNGEIAFERFGDVYLASPEGEGTKKITGDGVQANPAVSPDGAKIAYEYAYGIWVMNADGTGQTNLTPENSLPECQNQPGYLHRGMSSEPSWSPDRARIAFRGTVMCPHTGGTDIWVMGADGGGKVNLTNDNGTGDNHPAFSPDGTKIAFNSSRPSGDPTAVYLIGAGGGPVTRLASSPGFDNDPDWGPPSPLRRR